VHALNHCTTSGQYHDSGHTKKRQEESGKWP